MTWSLIDFTSVPAVAVKWGIMSTADINRKLLAGRGGSPTASRSSRSRAATERRRRRSRASTGSSARLSGYDALLADPEVEVVYIPLPNSMHVEWTLRAIAAGKHVLCEKPLTRRPIEVEEVFDAAERAGVVVQEAFMYRHHPQTRRWAELIRDGRGRTGRRDPRAVQLRHARARERAPAARASTAAR